MECCGYAYGLLFLIAKIGTIVDVYMVFMKFHVYRDGWNWPVLDIQWVLHASAVLCLTSNFTLLLHHCAWLKMMVNMLLISFEMIDCMMSGALSFQGCVQIKYIIDFFCNNWLSDEWGFEFSTACECEDCKVMII